MDLSIAVIKTQSTDYITPTLPLACVQAAPVLEKEEGNQKSVDKGSNRYGLYDEGEWDDEETDARTNIGGSGAPGNGQGPERRSDKYELDDPMDWEAYRR